MPTSTTVACVAIAATLALQSATAWRYFAAAPIGTDDEGYLTVVIRSWADGGALYSEVFSQYGPFHTVLFGLPMRLGNLSLSLSTGRTISAVLTTATVGLLAVTVWATTRRLAVTIASQLAVALVLTPETTMSHSMHPGVLITALLALVVVNVVVLRPRQPAWSDAFSGVIAVAILLTKLNVGVLLLAAFALTAVAMLTTTRRSPRLGILRVTTEVGFVVMGPVLLLSQLDVVRSGWVRLFPHNRVSTLIVWSACFAVGAAGLVLAARRAVPALVPDDNASAPPAVRPWAAPSSLPFAAGFGICGATVVGIVLATGSSLPDVVAGVFIRPAGQVRALMILPPLGGGTLVWLAVSSALVVAAVLVQRADPDRRSTAAVAASTRLAGGALLVWALIGERTLDDGGVIGLLPLVALTLLRTGAPRSPADPPTRLFLAAVAVGQTLHAYPVAGAQVAWASLLLVPVAALVIADGTDHLRKALPGRSVPVSTLVVAMPAMMYLAAMVIRSVDVAATTRTAYDTTVAVEALGDPRLRLPPGEAAWFGWLEGALDGCDAVVTSPGMNSVHVVLGIDPVTGFNTTIWTELLTDPEQQAIVDRLDEAGTVCVVSADAAYAVITEAAGLRRDQPLERYLDDSPTHVTSEHGLWQVLRIGEP